MTWPADSRRAERPRQRVLVLLATHNGSEWLAEQLQSVLAQDDVDVSILVRDDESTDSTRSIVTDLAQRDDRITLWPDHSARGSAAQNFFELVRIGAPDSASFVAFCDQDDVWLPEKLSRALACIGRSGAHGYSTPVTARWPDGREKVLRQNPAMTAADYLFEGAGQGCTFVLSPALFDELKGIVLSHQPRLADIHYHDWASYAVARALNMAWYFDNVPTVIYRQHGTNDTGARGSVRGVLRRLQKIGDGWYRRQVLAITALVAAIAVQNAAASRWRQLSGQTSPLPALSTLRRAVFIFRAGRRSGADRLVQMVAVLLGRL